MRMLVLAVGTLLATIGIAAVSLALGLSLLAKDDALDEVAPDVPVRIEKDIFHPPIRLAASNGIIDSGPSWGHSGPWVTIQW